MDPEIRKNALLWAGCVAGALEENEYRAKLAAAGFGDIRIEPTRIYHVEDARAFLAESPWQGGGAPLAQGPCCITDGNTVNRVLPERDIDVDALAAQADGKFMSAFIRATKPVSTRA